MNLDSHRPNSGRLTRPAMAGVYLIMSMARPAMPHAQSELDLLPQPTGQFSIGRAEFQFVDEHRSELFTEDPDDKRAIVVTLWYPAVVGAKDSRAVYMAGPLSRAYIESGWASWPASFGDQVLTHSFTDAPVAKAESPFPIVIFSHGHGVDPLMYTSLIEEVTSHGYVVAGINHSYSSVSTTFTDGRTEAFREPWAKGATSRAEQGIGMRRVVDTMAGDVSFVISRLAALADGDERFSGHLDTTRIAAMGHSIGGPAAGIACMDDERIKATVHLDSSIYGKNIEHDMPLILFNTEDHAMNEQYYEGLPGATYFVVFPESDHMSFSDTNILEEHFGDEVAPYGGRAESLVRLMNSYVLGFLNKHLRRRATPQFDAGFKFTRK